MPNIRARFLKALLTLHIAHVKAGAWEQAAITLRWLDLLHRHRW